MAASKVPTHSLSSGSAEAVDSPCSICLTRDKREVESSHYCVDCDANMCAACTQSHVCYPLMASHQVVDITRAPGTPAQKPQLPTQRCGEHHGKIIDQYCLDDNAVACETCVNVYHRNCTQMKYIPKIAKGTSKTKSSQAIQNASAELMAKQKQMKSSKENDVQQLDKAEAKSCQGVQDLRTRLHKYVDNLADAEDAKIKSEFRKKKGNVQKDIAAIEDDIDANETISKHLKDCKGDNESELFVYIKQGEKLMRDVNQTLQNLSNSKVAIPTYKINSTIEMSLKDAKSLGQFEKMTHVKPESDIRVRDAKEKNVCSIYGICLLPDASLIMTDFNNESLKLVDASYNLAGYLGMPESPYDVCYTDNNEVAVTLFIGKKVQFVSVGSTMQKTRVFDVGHLCRGIDYSNGDLFVCCGESVRVYSLLGNLLRTIQPEQAGQTIFKDPTCITVSSCGSKLYVRSKELITTDRTGKLLGTSTGLGIMDIRGVHCLDTGDLLICAYTIKSVYHVSGDGRTLKGKVLTAKDGLTNSLRAVCYDSAHCKLFVTMDYSDEIKVYDVQF